MGEVRWREVKEVAITERSDPRIAADASTTTINVSHYRSVHLVDNVGLLNKGDWFEFITDGSIQTPECTARFVDQSRSMRDVATTTSKDVLNVALSAVSGNVGGGLRLALIAILRGLRL